MGLAWPSSAGILDTVRGGYVAREENTRPSASETKLERVSIQQN